MMSMEYLPSLHTGLELTSSNLCVKGLPCSIDESTLCEIFSNFGDIQSCRVSRTSGSTKVGYVNLSSASQARDAVNALNGAPTDSGVLEVIPGPPAPSRQLLPCDNVYVRNLPSSWSEQDLRDLFSPFGTVQECRILHRGDDVRGAGALVRLNSVEAASQSIATLNGHVPRTHLGDTFSNTPLLVRFADSPEEKARKQARKEQMATRVHRSLDLPSLSSQELDGFPPVRRSSLPAGFQAFGPTGLLELTQATTPSTLSTTSLFAEPLQSETLDALLNSLGPSTPHHSSEALSLPSCSVTYPCFGSPGKSLVPPPPPPPPPPPAASCASLYVKNLPPETDKLWLYERFSPHGAILSVKVLQEEHSTRCRGVGFVNYTEPQGAMNAIHNVNGVKVADKHLHVSLQTNRGRI